MRVLGIVDANGWCRLEARISSWKIGFLLLRGGFLWTKWVRGLSTGLVRWFRRLEIN